MWRYLIEQSQSQYESVISRMKKGIDIYNNLSNDKKNAIKNDPNDNGKVFYDKINSVIGDFVKVSNSPELVDTNYRDANKEDINKTVSNFMSMVEKASSSDTFNQKYKSKFDVLKKDVIKIDTTAAKPETTPPPIETNRTEEEVKADLDAAIKSKDQTKASKLFDELAAVRKKEKPSYEPEDLLKKYPAEIDAPKSPEITPTSDTPTSTPSKTDPVKKGYSGVSIVDYLDQSGKPSDFSSRKELATKMGIPNYTGTASQNLLMLNALKSGKTEIPIKRAEPTQPSQETPKIKFGSSDVTAYVDMGGGRYAPATEDQLGDPNVQLYVKNPKKGQGEYLKPNYVKVRREGGELRRQSQFGGALGSLSNFLGDVGNTLAKPSNNRRSDYNSQQQTSETPTQSFEKPKKQKSNISSSNVKNKNLTYQRNPEDVSSFFKT